VGERGAAVAATNDDFANAFAITTTPFTHSVSTVAFTSQPGDPSLVDCGDQNHRQQSHSAWYRFTPGGSGQLSADTFDSDPLLDTVIALFADGTPLQQVACNDDTAGGGWRSSITAELVAGQTYYLEVMSSGLTGGGDMTLDVTYTGATTVATALAFVVQPSSTLAGQAISPAPMVALKAANGETVTTDSTTMVTLALQVPGSPDPAPKLTCTNGLLRMAQAGVVQWDGCSVDRAAAGLMLVATAGQLVPDTSTSFTVSNPLPGITSLSPTGAIAGTGAFTLTINGTGFAPGATVQFGNASPRTPATATTTKLTLALTAADIASAGSRTVTVTNPGPGGGTSTPVSFAVDNPPPAISSLSSVTKTVGSAGFILTIHGTKFLTDSVVAFGLLGTITPTTVTPTAITVALTTDQLTVARVYDITVVNPPPGGGSSNSVSFAVVNPSPLLTSITPAQRLTTDGAFTLTINGQGFIADSVVEFAGDELELLTMTANRITVAIPANLLTTAGPRAVTVTNPGPGGGASNALTLAVLLPPPVITALGATVLTRGQNGDGNTMLEINGTGFLATSVARWAGTAHQTQYVSPTLLRMTLSAADLSLPGQFPVTVLNPGQNDLSNGILVRVRSRADANCDGTVTPGDAQHILRVIAGTTQAIAGCDPNADGVGATVAPTDALYVLRVLAALEPMP
jgi:hypothetical protein